jgi:hypothetical protein
MVTVSHYDIKLGKSWILRDLARRGSISVEGAAYDCIYGILVFLLAFRK